MWRSQRTISGVSVALVIAVPLLAFGGGAVASAAEPPPRKRAPDTPVLAPRCVGDAAIKRARDYAKHRPGIVTFAVQERGKLSSYRGGVPLRSASLVKAMLLVTDLRRHAASHAPLSGGDRDRLRRMITVSDNGAATATFNVVGRGAVLRLARAAGMRHYSVGGGWGTSQLTASDQARFWAHLDHLLPRTYRAYGRLLLRSISHGQVWGGAPVTRRHGFRTMFKSGWLPQPAGWLVHQGLRIERGSCTIGITVLTGHQRSMAAGITSIRGVVERLV